MDSVLIVLFSKNNYNTDCVTGPRPHTGIRILLKPHTFFIRIGLPSTRTQWTLDTSLRSNRFRASSSRKLGREQKKGMTGEGKGREGGDLFFPTLPRSIFFFFRSRSNPIVNACHAGYLHIETAYLWNRSPGWVFFYPTGLANSCGYFFFIRRVWRIHVDFFLSDGFGEFMWNYVIN